MINLLYQSTAVIKIALRRLVSQRWLVLVTGLGLVIAVAFTLSIPLYADATHFRLLREALLGPNPTNTTQTPLPFLFQYSGATSGLVQWQDARGADSYMTSQVVPFLGLPPIQVVRFFRTDSIKVFPPLDPNRTDTQYFLDWMQLGFISQPEKNLKLVAGALPSATPTSDGPVEALINEKTATDLGLSLGETLYARRDNMRDIPITLVGIWTAADPQAPYWDSTSQKLLLVNEATYAGRISLEVKDELNTAQWYIMVDGSKLHSGDVGGLSDRMAALNKHIYAILPGIDLRESPMSELSAYQKNAPTLTLLLYAFSIPIIGLTLAFIGLVTGMFVSQHQNEIAILRSRGASVGEVVGITTVEGLLLGLFALAAGVPAGELIARLIGRARSFMDFTAPTQLRIGLTPQALAFGLAAIGFVLLIQIIVPTLAAAGRTVVTYKQERARQVRPPWWQRAWLDLAAFIPAAYAIFLLKQQGSIAQGHGAISTDPFQNPLLLLAPAMAILAVTLFLLRLIPAIMALVAWIASRTNSVGFLMASRYLARSPALYNTPLALLVLTLSLSAFTASLAQTLDNQLNRQSYYQVGANLAITEDGILPPRAGALPPAPWEAQGKTGAPGVSQSGQDYLFDPVDDHLRLPGVLAATRVGRMNASLVPAGSDGERGVFLGIDRLTFPQVAFWAPDFSGAQLGELMNALAANPHGVIVSRDFIKKYKLSLGDSLTIQVNTGNSSLAMDTVIVGVVGLFPTWYPENGALAVGNLDYLYSQANTELPHQVWLKTTAKADYAGIVSAVKGYTVFIDPSADHYHVVENGLNTFVEDWTATQDIITAEQRRPERQGLFGLLSVGFGTSAMLTVLGFLLYALFSFRRRFIELGMLRAIGLSAGQMSVLLASELAFLIGIGIGVGTLLGVSISKIFIPFLQVGANAASRFPPFVVVIAWPSIIQIYLLFISLFLVALGVLAPLLLRMKIFQAVKLGETI